MLPRILTAGLAVISVLLSACGSSPTASTQSASTTQSTSVTATASSTVSAATPAPLLTSDESVQALGAFSCSDRDAATSGSHTTVADVRMGQHMDFDRIVFEFGGPLSGYRVLRQSSTTFTQDPSGRSVSVDGSAGVRVVLTMASSMDYKGARDFKPGFAALREARLIGDFESVTTWALGLSRASCLRVLTLSNPNRLVIDIQH